ncbi:hypothetical protein G6728_01710 [Polynucleobacter paneuropaeus]|nr:hypothetical protein G6728_01710 [Polynucleobacter paneuropaeus]
MKILIVCSAGKKSGIGHLSRSTVIHQNFKESFEYEVELLVVGDEVMGDYLNDYKFNLLEKYQDLESSINSLVIKFTPDVVVFDLDKQNIPAGFYLTLKSLRAKGVKLVAIDGMFDFRADLDLIYLPAIFCPDEYLRGSGASIVYGWDCLLLSVHTPENLHWVQGNDALILTGGSDATSLGKIWPQILNDVLKAGSIIHWVRGPFADSPAAIKDPRVNFNIHNAPKGLGQLMSCVSYAATVFGVSFFELMHYGLPTVVFSPYGKKDEAILREIRRLGLAMVAEDEREAGEMLAMLMDNHEMALKLSKTALSFAKKSNYFRLGAEVNKLF